MPLPPTPSSRVPSVAVVDAGQDRRGAGYRGLPLRMVKRSHVSPFKARVSSFCFPELPDMLHLRLQPVPSMGQRLLACAWLPTSSPSTTFTFKAEVWFRTTVTITYEAGGFANDAGARRRICSYLWRAVRLTTNGLASAWRDKTRLVLWTVSIPGRMFRFIRLMGPSLRCSATT